MPEIDNGHQAMAYAHPPQTFMYTSHEHVFTHTNGKSEGRKTCTLFIRKNVSWYRYHGKLEVSQKQMIQQFYV